MKEYFLVYAPWFLSVVSIIKEWLTGDLKRVAWLIGLFGQAVWLAWIITSETWGFLPLNVMLWITYTRNYRKWGKL